MRYSNIASTSLILLVALFLAACDLALEPHDGLTSEETLSSIEGLRAATQGNYYFLLGQEGPSGGYARLLHNEGEYPGDNVSLSGTTSNPLFFTYNYQHAVNSSSVEALWRTNYRIIYGANRAIDGISEISETSDNPEQLPFDELEQLQGENYFLRALAHFHLVNIFGRPYTHGRDNPGIPIRHDADVEARPERNTVGEVYDAIIADLEQAAELMNEEKSIAYASDEVVYALLSRIYLYMEENERAIEYANRVIESGRYELVDTESLPETPTWVPENNPETIFAIRFTPEQSRGFGMIGSMYYRSEGGVGWGEMYASESYRDLIDRHPEDVRRDFIQPDYERDDDGNIVTDENGEPVIGERNGYPRYYVMKFSYQEGNVTLSSPALLRLAEMYLNRAEANAKLGNSQGALDDVNLIRERAGLSGNALYSSGDLGDHDSVLDVVLEERRLELAFEAHRKYDIFRNQRPLVRDYPGTHLVSAGAPGVNEEEGTQIIPPDHPRVVQFIPETEIELNPNLEQNP